MNTVAISKSDIDLAFQLSEPIPHDLREITHRLLYRPDTRTFYHASPAKHGNGTEWDMWELRRLSHYLQPRYVWDYIWTCHSLDELKSRLSDWGIEEVGHHEPLPSWEALSRLYELVYGPSVYQVERVGRPKCNQATWDYIYEKFKELDSVTQPGMIPGAGWECRGWEIDNSLPDWEVLPAPLRTPQQTGDPQ
jgi:hypothetical protein